MNHFAALKKAPRAHHELSEEAQKRNAILQFMKNIGISIKRNSEGIFREIANMISFRTASRLAKTSMKEVKKLAHDIAKMYREKQYHGLKELFLQIEKRQSAKAIERRHSSVLMA